MLRLQQYDYEVYRCSSSNIADQLFRLSVSAGIKQQQNVAEKKLIRFNRMQLALSDETMIFFAVLDVQQRRI